MTSTILTSTERGQITLPKQWRDKFSTDTYVVELHKDRLVLLPLQIDIQSDEEVLFDADRDNDGEGVSPDDLIKALKKIRHG